MRGQGQKSRRSREVPGPAQPDQGSKKQRRCASIERQRLPNFQVRKCEAACELPQQHERHRRGQHHKKVGQLWSDIECQAGECRSAQRTRNGKREQEIAYGRVINESWVQSSIARIEFPSA
jgi:hypothetical protein